MIGFAIYGRKDRCIELHNLAVHPSCQRRGVGSLMVEKPYCQVGLVSPLQTRPVRTGRKLDCQLFLRQLGFRCTEVVPEGFEDTRTGELTPAYEFAYDLALTGAVHVGIPKGASA